MKKKHFILLFVIGLIFMTGCDFIKLDNMEDINIITTNYSLEYVIRYLYGDHSIINSIYPDGVDISTYNLNSKALDNYSKENLFIYLSFGNDKDIAVQLLNRNKNLLIIDGSLGMSPDYLEEIWLNPSNLLMVAQNIKNGLAEYIDNNYLLKDINLKFDELKLKLSELDAEIMLTAENGSSDTIVVADKSLTYLRKYGFNVISLDNDNNALDKSIKEVIDLGNVSQIKYIYKFENEELNDAVNEVLENSSNIKVLDLRKIDNITTDERNNGFDYFTLMEYNLEQIKKETYK